MLTYLLSSPGDEARTTKRAGESPARFDHLNPDGAVRQNHAPRNTADLLHRLGFAVFQALVDNRLDLDIGIARQASLLRAEPALSLA